jgi:hypothetical protein
MKPGDLILRNEKPDAFKRIIGSLLSAVALHGVMLSFLVMLLLATVVAAADICRAASGNLRLFHSFDSLAQNNSVDPNVEKERLRLERSDLDNYRNESRRWRQLKAELKERSSLKKSKNQFKLNARI